MYAISFDCIPGNRPWNVQLCACLLQSGLYTCEEVRTAGLGRGRSWPECTCDGPQPRHRELWSWGWPSEGSWIKAEELDSCTLIGHWLHHHHHHHHHHFCHRSWPWMNSFLQARAVSNEEYVAVRLQQLSSCFWEMEASASEEGTWTNQHKHPPQESNHTAIHVQFTQTHAHSYFGDCVHQIVCYANKVMTSRKFEGYQYREGVFSWQNDSSLISLPTPPSITRICVKGSPLKLLC